MPAGADYLRWLGTEADRLAGQLRQLRRDAAAPAPPEGCRAADDRLARAVDAALPHLTEVAEALRALGRRQDSAPAGADGGRDGPRRQALTWEEEAEEASRRGA
jgi:hypothetical protein